jgi:hypothetical protein
MYVYMYVFMYVRMYASMYYVYVRKSLYLRFVLRTFINTYYANITLNSLYWGRLTHFHTDYTSIVANLHACIEVITFHCYTRLIFVAF